MMAATWEWITDLRSRQSTGREGMSSTVRSRACKSPLLPMPRASITSSNRRTLSAWPWRASRELARLIGGRKMAPNIVFILVDNVGWGDFGAYGGTIPTPRIDKCAGEGIRFNNYNVEVQCTPTRSAILTG